MASVSLLYDFLNVVCDLTTATSPAEAALLVLAKLYESAGQ